MDIEPGNMSLDNLLKLNKPLNVAKGGFTSASQCLMVAIKNHPLFKDIIDYVKINYKKKWYDFNKVLYVQRTTGGLIYQKMLDKYSNDYIVIPQNLVYRCESIDDCKIENNMVAMIHFEKSWNLLLYSQRFIEYYKKIIFITSIFLIYLIYSDCKNIGINNLCKAQNIISYFIILSLIYLILNYSINNSLSRDSIVHIILLILAYYSLNKKCDICAI
jgi:hypothetical protein